MKRALCLLVLAGCARLETNVRTERGAVFETKTVRSIEPGSVMGEVNIEWPRIRITLTQRDVCREQTIEHRPEVTITEHTSNATGPSLSMGIANVLASGVLFLTSLAVSSQPNENTIDVAGRYGPSTRQYVQGAGWVTLGIGLPALAVGLISALRTHDEVDTKVVEELAAQHERDCNHRPYAGSVEVNGSVTRGAVVELDATTMTGPLNDVRAEGGTVTMTDEALGTIDSLNACLSLHTLVLERADEGSLFSQLELLVRCKTVNPGASAQIDAVTGELNRRREGQSSYRPVPQFGSYDEALTALAPKLTLMAGYELSHDELSADTLTGQAVRFAGQVVAEPTLENVGLLLFGELEVLVFVPPDAPWRDVFKLHARVEGIAVMQGVQAARDRRMPLMRAVWGRRAF